MARRRSTLKRIDAWSVLKFGFVANLAGLVIWLLSAGVLWFLIERLQLISKVCDIAFDIGFDECSVNGGNVFRFVFLLGLLMVVVNTGVWVFLAFLYNLIADLVGGLTVTVVDEHPVRATLSGDRRDERSAIYEPPPEPPPPRRPAGEPADRIDDRGRSSRAPLFSQRRRGRD